jgi:hypothetical protein
MCFARITMCRLKRQIDERGLLLDLESFILGELQPSEFRSAACAPVAQLDRAIGYEPIGRRFDSFRAHHTIYFFANSPLGSFFFASLATPGFFAGDVVGEKFIEGVLFG